MMFGKFFSKSKPSTGGKSGEGTGGMGKRMTSMSSSGKSAGAAASISAKDDQLPSPSSPSSSIVSASMPPKYTRPKRSLSVPIDVLNEVLFREEGTVMDRIAPGRRPQEVCVVFSPRTYLISWFAGSTRGKLGTHIGQVDVGEIKEVRAGLPAANTKDFRAGVEGPNPDRDRLALCILYGTEFRLKQLCFYVRSKEELIAWSEGLTWHTQGENALLYDFPLALPRWLEKHWHALDRQMRQSIVSKDVRLWLQRVNYKLSPKEIKDYFQMVDRLKQNVIGQDEFTELYHLLVDQPAVTDEFARFSSSKTLMTAEDLLRFFHEQQGETAVTLEDCQLLREEYAGPGGPFRVATFVEYLHSKRNDLWNPRHNDVHQDMSQPLSHYFIASSHNTYLMGDQFRSESSVEAYIRALRAGCRCIEIDTWDGPFNEPIVFHGHTLTSKIKFRDVLVSVREHAFETSEFPLILSIENHCSLSQQEVMAAYFKEVFGSMLVTEPLHPTATMYPSPLELLRRVIIKHKKLEAGDTEVVTTHKDDISSSILNGFLFVEDKIDHTWSKHYFVLTESTLSYMEAQDDEPEQAEDSAGEEDKANQSELHYGEPWFHGDLRPGKDPTEAREAAAALILANNKGDGTFLVRESRTHGGYALSFLFEGKVQHCRIRSKDGRYFLTDQATFPNLYELVEYFKREPLRTVGYSVLLSEPVPPPAPHKDKKWFHKSLSRSEAEDWLKRIRSDGAFLVRANEVDKNAFAISFRAEGKVKHCRIKKEGRMYCIGDAEFESLVKLVEYYEKHPLYRKMRLRYPVDEELIQSQGEEVEEDIYHCEELYQEPNAFDKGQQKRVGTITCKAVYAYTAKNPDELSFPKDAIITNVVKKDLESGEAGWWQGDYGGVSGGWLPCNYVEELDFEDMAKEDKSENEDNPLGLHQKAEFDVQHLEVKPRPSTKDMRLVFRIQNSLDPRIGVDVGTDSEEEMRAWWAAITRAAENQSKATSKEQELQKKSGIHKNLSDLIFYSQSVTFPGFDKCNNPKDYHKMSSFMEKKAEVLCRNNAKEFNEYHYRQLSRVYPNGKRLDSSNFDPQPMWNAGCQLVALNYQHFDKPLWLNHGRFLLNGNSGYVLKPELQRQQGRFFDPSNIAPLKLDPLVLSIRIISARHLVKPTRGIASPFVEVEVVGVDDDCNKYKTRTVTDNGLCPAWNEETHFTVSVPELATLRFIVYDEDMFGDPNTIGQACFPLGSRDDLSIRPGFRSISLKNVYNEPLELSSLLIYVDVSIQPSNDEYQSLQELRAELRRQHQKRDDLVHDLAKHGITTDTLKSAELQRAKEAVLELEKKLMSSPSPLEKIKHVKSKSRK